MISKSWDPLFGRKSTSYKGNDNHDHLGRFASVDGRGGTAAVTRVDAGSNRMLIVETEHSPNGHDLSKASADKVAMKLGFHNSRHYAQTDGKHKTVHTFMR